MTGNDLIPHLFRTEYGKMVSVLTKICGLKYIEIAEDLVSETFMAALDIWPYKGIPDNPTAWLYTVAKNKLKNHFTRDAVFSEIISKKLSEKKSFDEINIDFSERNISDSQLQMLFAICHPSISVEAQICLALRILCGLGLNEIADGLLVNKETIHKRLQRAKTKLRSEIIKIAIPDDEEIKERLNTVIQTLYLLFSEGYYSESNNLIVRKDLCIEAINLTYLLLANSLTNNHNSNALMSLMCFHASRLDARLSINGSIILYDKQDKSLWDTELIEMGFYYLQQAAQWQNASAYYIEACIAYWHTIENSNPEKWQNILKLYDILLITNNSLIVTLSRIWALSKVSGNFVAIEEAKKLNANTSHFYYVLLAELSKNIDPKKACYYLEKAMYLCKTDTETQMIRKQITELRQKLAI